jgi:hypothetical protein
MGNAVSRGIVSKAVKLTTIGVLLVPSLGLTSPAHAAPEFGGATDDPIPDCAADTGNPPLAPFAPPPPFFVIAPPAPVP